MDVFLILSSTPFLELLDALEWVPWVIVSVNTEATVGKGHHHGVRCLLLLGKELDGILKHAEIEQLANVKVEFLWVSVLLGAGGLLGRFLFFVLQSS